jgi:hypothetical protein
VCVARQDSAVEWEKRGVVLVWSWFEERKGGFSFSFSFFFFLFLVPSFLSYFGQGHEEQIFQIRSKLS